MLTIENLSVVVSYFTIPEAMANKNFLFNALHDVFCKHTEDLKSQVLAFMDCPAIKFEFSVYNPHNLKCSLNSIQSSCLVEANKAMNF